MAQGKGERALRPKTETNPRHAVRIRPRLAPQIVQERAELGGEPILSAFLCIRRFPALPFLLSAFYFLLLVLFHPHRRQSQLGDLP